MPVALSGLLAFSLSGVPVTVGGVTLTATVYLPLIACTLAALWFGVAWGAVPAFVAGIVVALAGGLPVHWALVVGLVDPLALGVLVLAYQAAPVSTTLRSPTALVFFLVVAFVTVLTSSAGAFVWAHAMGEGAGETLVRWQGWWVGGFLQQALVTAPLLLVCGPAVERWKRQASLEPERPEALSPARLGFAFGVVIAALGGYVLLVRYFGWLQLDAALGRALGPDVRVALDGLSLIQWITLLFVALVAFFGWQVARGWTATAAQLAQANARLEEALADRELGQARLIEYAGKLEEANRSRDLFFSIISHDLRGPMGALLGLSEVAENRLAGAPATERHADRELVELAGLMHRSAEHLYSLLINLLEWARLQTGQMRCRPEWLALDALAEQVTGVLAGPAAEKGVWLRSRVAPGTVAWADPVMVRSVLLNLVGNGLKFTREGGTVTVRAERAGAAVAVVVEDTGVGMAPEDVAQLFRIESTRSRTGTAGERGSGLGLILCREMVERNGGAIAVESEPGAGSQFRFTLPAVPHTANGAATTRAAVAEDA